MEPSPLQLVAVLKPAVISNAVPNLDHGDATCMPEHCPCKWCCTVQLKSRTAIFGIIYQAWQLSELKEQNRQSSFTCMLGMLTDLKSKHGLCPAELQEQLAQAGTGQVAEHSCAATALQSSPVTGLVHHKVHKLPGRDFLIAVLFQVMPLQYQACSSGAAQGGC